MYFYRSDLNAVELVPCFIACRPFSNSSLLSEELAAAVENLVMLPNIPGVSETSRDSGSSEAIHDYAEIYTPSREGMNWAQSAQGPRPPTPPLHRFPSWEAKIYQVKDSFKVFAKMNSLKLCKRIIKLNYREGRNIYILEILLQVADGGLGIGPPTNEESAPSTMTNTTSSSKHSQATGHNLTAHNSQGYCDISVPVYATVKGRSILYFLFIIISNNIDFQVFFFIYYIYFSLGRASQIRSMPFGDSSDDSSDGEEHPNQTETNTRITNSSSDNTDSSLGSGSSPSKSVKTTSSLSPAKRSSSGSPSKSVKRGKHFVIARYF